MKYIREGRFGPPKCWKTGSIVSTYPKPMLVFEYEQGGLEIIKDYSSIKWLPYTEVMNPPSPIPSITAIDFSFKPEQIMLSTPAPSKDSATFDHTVDAINRMAFQADKTKPFPYKTVVFDSVTSLSESILRHISANNAALLVDARKWAGIAGAKVAQVIGYLGSLPCNTVFIFHTETNKDEDTKVISEQPMMYSKLRDSIGKDFSQFFYQGVVGREVKVRVKAFDYVKGIGARWPHFGEQELIGPTFNDIYGMEKDVYK
jgi:hypothetical protein